MLTLNALDPVFIYANYVEACLWVGLGLLALLKCQRPSGVILGVALMAFGVSDVVEVQTGAWYRSWWMLAWKVACLGLMVASGARLIHLRARKL